MTPPNSCKFWWASDSSEKVDSVEKYPIYLISESCMTQRARARHHFERICLEMSYPENLIMGNNHRRGKLNLICSSPVVIEPWRQCRRTRCWRVLSAGRAIYRKEQPHCQLPDRQSSHSETKLADPQTPAWGWCGNQPLQSSICSQWLQSLKTGAPLGTCPPQLHPSSRAVVLKSYWTDEGPQTWQISVL